MRGRILAWPSSLRSPWSETTPQFDMADENTLADAEQSLIDDLVTGVESFTHDGTSVRAFDPRARKDVLDELKGDDAAKQVHRGLRFTRLRSPGCG